MDCLFCKIADKSLNSDTVYEDEQVVAFNDISPKAPTHILIIPRKHIATINDLGDEDTDVVGYMVQTAKRLAQEIGIAESGYRLVFNVNRGAGQAVFHIHLHLLGGRSMEWPPG